MASRTRPNHPTQARPSPTMPANRRLFFSILLSCLASALPQAMGQSRSSDAQPTVRFLAERSNEQIGQVQMAAGEAAGEAFDLPTNHLSTARPAPARAFILRTVDKQLPLAQIKLPEQGKAFIVLLIPSPKGGFSTEIISSNDPSFKGGDVYLFNHSNRPVIGYVGTARFLLDPSKGRVLRPAGAKDNAYFDVGFGVREEQGDRALSSTRWPVDPQARSYVFFFVNPKTNRIDFRAVDELVPAGE